MTVGRGRLVSEKAVKWCGIGSSLNTAFSDHGDSSRGSRVPKNLDAFVAVSLLDSPKLRLD